jgi:hypothetical protein
MLIPIGQFSKMTRLSVKALRLYDENGLLAPARADASTGHSILAKRIARRPLESYARSICRWTRSK